MTTLSFPSVSVVAVASWLPLSLSERVPLDESGAPTAVSVWTGSCGKCTAGACTQSIGRSRGLDLEVAADRQLSGAEVADASDT